jgi:UDP-N-acetylglucosamine/UDP-N-acetylgalactosamine diphosphorylase
MDSIASMCARLEACGQSHLSSAVRTSPELLETLGRIDWEAIPSLVDRLVHHRPSPPAGDLHPAACVSVNPASAGGSVTLLDEAPLRSRGEAMLSAGRVAVFTVAGGQGTRLGWNGPKGTFPASPVMGKPLFRLFAEQILAAEQRWGCRVRWYIMTSCANDSQTRGFFLDNRCFGLDRRQIMMFPQGMMPAFDAKTGNVLMDSPHSLAMSPDGHGGSYAALLRCGAIDQMEGRGIEAISYHQVDNPLAPILDPVFLGLHADPDHSSGEFSSKMVLKVGPDEKVGVFAVRAGLPGVVEYSDMTQAQATAVDANGRLQFSAGNLAMHVISTEFARRVAMAGEDALPWHRADKMVAHIDPSSGERVEPTEPNAVKLERFVFDAMPVATKSAILEVDRASSFAPIKNASGADSAESSRQLQSDLYASWLEEAGVTVPRRADGLIDATIEISPLTAMSAADLAAATLPDHVAPGSSITL